MHNGRRILRLTLADIMSLVVEKAGKDTPADLRIIDILPHDRSCLPYDIQFVVESAELIPDSEDRYGQVEAHDLSSGPVSNWRRFSDILPENYELYLAEKV